jgi:hypothetical protein
MKFDEDEYDLYREKQNTIPLEAKINKIFDKYLYILDFELYNHLIDMKCEPSIFLQ